MRTANAYQSLNEAHERINGDTALPGTRYEAVRETQYGIDDRVAQNGATPAGADRAQPTIDDRLDSIEARLKALDSELAAIRTETRAPEIGAVHTYTDADIDRLFELHGRPGDEPPTPSTTETRERIGPERWTNSAGMVDQQASAREWLEHNAEQRQRQSAPERGQDSGGLSPEAVSVLNAAREHEADGHQQERDRDQARDYPAP